jgi:hypothetical protein
MDRNNSSRQFIYNVFGIITGTSVTPFPDIPCQQANLMAYASNIGSFFIGHQSGTSQCVWELDAGEETGWFDIENLNNLYYKNGSGTSDFLAYWIQK